MPRAAEMSPRSTMRSSGQPKLRSSFATSAFAPPVVSADEDVVLAGYARRVDHHLAVDRIERLDDPSLRKEARWICSPRLSVPTTNKVGGMPCENSSGFET